MKTARVRLIASFFLIAVLFVPVHTAHAGLFDFVGDIFEAAGDILGDAVDAIVDVAEAVVDFVGDVVSSVTDGSPIGSILISVAMFYIAPGLGAAIGDAVGAFLTDTALTVTTVAGETLTGFEAFVATATEGGVFSTATIAPNTLTMFNGAAEGVYGGALSSGGSTVVQASIDAAQISSTVMDVLTGGSYLRTADAVACLGLGVSVTFDGCSGESTASPAPAPSCDGTPTTIEGYTYCVPAGYGNCRVVDRTTTPPQIACDNVSADLGTISMPELSVNQSGRVMDAGQSGTITWRAPGATACEFVGTPAGGVSTHSATLNAAGISTGSLSQTTPYQIRCTYSNGNTVLAGSAATLLSDNGTGTQTFTSTGTFTVPEGVTSLTVDVIAGGGAGGGGTNEGAGGGGGGGGRSVDILTVTGGTVLNVIVGKGGRPAGARRCGPGSDASGGSGGGSAFGTITANGGGGGKTQGAGGAGGWGSTESGASGGNPPGRWGWVNGLYMIGGIGGASGSGAAGGAAGQSKYCLEQAFQEAGESSYYYCAKESPAVPPQPGSAYGGGGGGVFTSGTCGGTSTIVAGNGAPGIVTVNWTIPSCTNGANNPPSCNACTLPLVWDKLVSVCRPPIPASVTISASPQRVKGRSGSSTISWTATHANVTTCSITKDGAVWGTDVPATGKIDTAIVTQSLYAIASCKDSSDNPVIITGVSSRSTVVNVVPDYKDF